MTARFQTFNYHGSWWLFYLACTPLMFLWFIICGRLITYYDLNSVLWFLMPFLFGCWLIVIVASKFRYRNNGHLTLHGDLIKYKVRNKSKQKHLSSINEVAIYYYHKNPYIEYGMLGGFFRYRNLLFTDKTSEETLDRIEIDGDRIYVKIRNKKEAALFEEFIDALYGRIDRIRVFSTRIDDINSSDSGDFWILKSEKC